MQPHTKKHSGKSKLRGHVWPLFMLFFLLTAETIVFRYAYRTDLPRDAGSVKELTEPQKKLIDMETAYSTWLQTLAIGTLAALLGLRLKDWSDNRLLHTAPMLACALLADSVYSAHLVQISIIFTLGRGPVTLLYGDRMSVPLEVQFWTLLAGFGVLAVWLFRPKTAAPGILLLLICGHAAAAPPKNEWNSCIENWHQARSLTAPASLKDEAAIVSVLAKAVKHPVPKSTQCTLAFQAMDELRYRSFAAGGTGTGADVASLAAGLAPSLRTPNLSTTDALQLLVKLFQPWNPSSGLLELTSKKRGRKISIDGRVAGYQSYTARLPTGWHRFEVIDSGTNTMCREFYFNDGDHLAIDLDSSDSDYSATRQCSGPGGGN
jgi:hypothetical protein